MTKLDQGRMTKHTLRCISPTPNTHYNNENLFLYCIKIWHLDLFNPKLITNVTNKDMRINWKTTKRKSRKQNWEITVSYTCMLVKYSSTLPPSFPSMWLSPMETLHDHQGVRPIVANISCNIDVKQTKIYNFKYIQIFIITQNTRNIVSPQVKKSLSQRMLCVQSWQWKSWRLLSGKYFLI